MSLSISTIRSGKGDCIHLRFLSDRQYNIIIDTGSTSSAGAYRTLVNTILACGESIDALFLSHYDDDHIGGALKVTDVPYQAVYFNAYDGIAETANLSAWQNQRLLHMLSQTIVHTSVLAGDVIALGGAKITVLAPTQASLAPARQKMKEADIPLSANSDWCISLDDLKDRPDLPEDSSIANRASMVFDFAFDGQRLLFCGDAPLHHAQPSGHYDLVKLPHHGSAHNVSGAFLRSLDADTFLICADGTTHPSKQTIAKLLACKEKVILYSNYDWWMKGFLLPEDRKYVDSGRLVFRLK